MSQSQAEFDKIISSEKKSSKKEQLVNKITATSIPEFKGFRIKRVAKRKRPKRCDRGIEQDLLFKITRVIFSLYVLENFKKKCDFV